MEINSTGFLSDAGSLCGQIETHAKLIFYWADYAALRSIAGASEIFCIYFFIYFLKKSFILIGKTKSTYPTKIPKAVNHTK